MNITELARLLRVTPQELHDKLPLMGFDIGQKAIKVDNRTANQILKMWPSFIRRLQQAEERQKAEAAIKNMDPSLRPEVAVPAFVTVKNFAALSNLPINKILGELMKNGIFTSLNEKIDFETAMIIGADLGVTVILAPAEAESADQVNKVRDVLAGQEKAQMIQPAASAPFMGRRS